METKTFGARMEAARAKRGLAADEAAVDARRFLHGLRNVSRMTIYRLESGAITEDRADPFVVAALANVYGESTAKLSKIAAERLQRYRDLLERRIMCCSVFPDRRHLAHAS